MQNTEAKTRFMGSSVGAYLANCLGKQLQDIMGTTKVADTAEQDGVVLMFKRSMVCNMMVIRLNPSTDMCEVEFGHSLMKGGRLHIVPRGSLEACTDDLQDMVAKHLKITLA